MKKSKLKVGKQLHGDLTAHESGMFPTPEQIRQRAHEIYLARGGAAGQELDDWLQAERELKAEIRAMS